MIYTAVDIDEGYLDEYHDQNFMVFLNLKLKVVYHIILVSLTTNS